MKADWYAVTERIDAAIANNGGKSVTIPIDTVHLWSGADRERSDLRLPEFWKAEQAGYEANRKFLRAGLQIVGFAPERAPVREVTFSRSESG